MKLFKSKKSDRLNELFAAQIKLEEEVEILQRQIAKILIELDQKLPLKRWNKKISQVKDRLDLVEKSIAKRDEKIKYPIPEKETPK